MLAARAHPDQMATRAQQGHAVFQAWGITPSLRLIQWNYQINSIDRHRCNHMTNYLKEGMKKLTVKSVNYEKVKEVQQGPEESPAVFERRLMEAFRKYTYVIHPPKDRPFGYVFHSPICPRYQAQNSKGDF